MPPGSIPRRSRPRTTSGATSRSGKAWKSPDPARSPLGGKPAEARHRALTIGFQPVVRRIEPWRGGAQADLAQPAVEPASVGVVEAPFAAPGQRQRDRHLVVRLHPMWRKDRNVDRLARDDRDRAGA